MTILASGTQTSTGRTRTSAAVTDIATTLVLRKTIYLDQCMCVYAFVLVCNLDMKYWFLLTIPPIPSRTVHFFLYRGRFVARYHRGDGGGAISRMV